MVGSTVQDRRGDMGSASVAPGRRITAAVLGNAQEFYDFTVYAAFAVFIGHAFFPTEKTATKAKSMHSFLGPRNGV